MDIMKKKVVFAVLANFIYGFLYAEFFFSGFSGAKLDFKLYDPLAAQENADETNSSEVENETVNPNLEMSAFFSGQFNISNNIIIRTEFSVKTFDLISNSIFDSHSRKMTNSTFQIDEISMLVRGQMLHSMNYFSVFLGTYEPIGSDIFLRRQFGLNSISSKITESWMGMAGAIIYPLFGLGISDVVHFDKQPIAAGAYIYFNKEDPGYVFNADMRFGCAYRFFTLDVSAGLGFPLLSSEREDAYIFVEKIYSRAGLNMLIGNSYTTSFFLQAGFSKLPFYKSSDKSTDIDDVEFYFLLEPRFKLSMVEMDITFFSLPADTVSNFIFVRETLGVNINVFTDKFLIKNSSMLFGANTEIGFRTKNCLDFSHISDWFEDENGMKDLKIAIAPYIETQLFTGEIHAMIQIDITQFINEPINWFKAFELNLGYKVQF